MSKLPESIVHGLNAVGLGGRLIYVPLVKRTVSDEIFDAMTSTLMAGKRINLDEFQNMVSLRTLYRLRSKAIEEAERLRKRGKDDGQTEYENGRE
ncbi:MAG: hypothetical protein ABSA46_05640 [Thermodesulfovibrionales bacterium]